MAEKKPQKPETAKPDPDEVLRRMLVTHPNRVILKLRQRSQSANSRPNCPFQRLERIHFALAFIKDTSPDLFVGARRALPRRRLAFRPKFFL